MFHNRTFKMLVTLALLALLVAPRVALGQAPQGPTNPFHTEFDVTNHPSQFDEIAMLIQVAPSASNAVIKYGGDQFVTVIQGEVTVAGQVYPAGKNYVEKAGEPVTISNAGTTNARLISTILLPKGAALTSDAQTSAVETVIYKSQREFLTPPATFKVAQDVLEFAPNAGVPMHWHGGDVLGLVIEGQMTNHNGNTVTKINTGEGFLENTKQEHSIGNESNAPAAFFGTVILPPGGEVLTIDTSAPSPLPTTSTGNDPLTYLWLALVGGIVLVLGGWFIRKRAKRV